MKRNVQVLVRLSPDEHRGLARRAEALGVSVQEVIRRSLCGRGGVATLCRRQDALLLARIAAHLAVISERCLALEDATATVAILAHLVAIERELGGRPEARRVC